MAQGDVVIFQESAKYFFDGTFDLDTNTLKLAILDNTATPAAASTTPALADFTEVGTAGTYVAGGTALTVSLTQSGAAVTLDFTNNPSWAQDALNDVDAYWGLIYGSGTLNALTDPALGYVDLGGPVDMSALDLTVTWNASGVYVHTLA